LLSGAVTTYQEDAIPWLAGINLLLHNIITGNKLGTNPQANQSAKVAGIRSEYFPAPNRRFSRRICAISGLSVVEKPEYPALRSVSLSDADPRLSHKT